MTTALTAVICLAIAILGIWFQIRYTARAVTQGPALLTMLGIAGTFLGIAIGLHQFNPSDVAGSIPALLGGLRTSVWASFVGVFFAILIKLRYALAREEATESGDKSDVEVLVDNLTAIRNSISSGDDLTVASQIKLVRSEIGYKLDALAQTQAQLLDRLSETERRP